MDKSEYRHKQEKAEQKRRETSEHSERQQIIRTLDRIAEQHQATDNQANRADTFHRRLERLSIRLEGRRFYLDLAGTIGLWVAAAVGVTAISVASHDSEGQRQEMHGQLEAMKGQLDEIKRAYVPTKESADAARDAANAATKANATTRAQINSHLVIPDEPQSKIRIGPDGTVALDLYIANLGQSWARDIYANSMVTIKNGRTIIYQQLAFGAGFDVGPQMPSHGILDDFPKFTLATNVADELEVTITIALSYTNMFDEVISQVINLKAWRGDINAKCCTIKELGDSIELQRSADLSRIPNIPPR